MNERYELDRLMDEWGFSPVRDFMSFRDWIREYHPLQYSLVERVLGPVSPPKGEFRMADGRMIDPIDEVAVIVDEYAEKNPERAMTFWDWMRKERPDDIPMVEHIAGSALPPNVHGFHGT